MSWGSVRPPWYGNYHGCTDHGFRPPAASPEGNGKGINLAVILQGLINLGQGVVRRGVGHAWPPAGSPLCPQATNCSGDVDNRSSNYHSHNSILKFTVGPIIM